MLFSPAIPYNYKVFRRPSFGKAMIAAMFCVALPGLALAEDTPARDKIEAGEYIARAADCMSCHEGPDGTPYAGGRPISTPLGPIYASNISASREYGIGAYSEQDFRKVLRDGVSPEHSLYPAMPYPSYRGMTDEDISALFAFMMSTDPVDKTPENRTDLGFPYNMRFLMRFWDGVELGDARAASGQDEQVARGAYLVDHLAHCGTCHTPRDGLMGTDDSRYLGGAPLGSWHAPNITPDKTSGIGQWRAEDIVSYLKTGHAMNAAQAGGPMAEVVHYSTRHLKDEDLQAIAAYLRSVPALKTEGQVQPVFLAAADRTEYVHLWNGVRDNLAAALKRDDLSNAERIYVTNCAACHDVNGHGQPEAYYPPLMNSGAVRRNDPTNVIAAIARGVDQPTLYRAPLMPGFQGVLSNDEIASVANYVRAEFGGNKDSALNAGDVEKVLNPAPDLPFLVRYAGVLMVLGLLVALAVFVLLIWKLRTRRPAGAQA